MMILEMTAYYKKLNMTLSDALEKLYENYGLYRERTVDIYMEGLDGIEKRRKVMQSLRDNPPAVLGGVAVLKSGDYQTGVVTNLVTGDKESTGQPASDVLYYTLENEDKIIVRPSGTEPKIKIYILAHGTDAESTDAKVSAYEIDAKKITEV